MRRAVLSVLRGEVSMSAALAAIVLAIAVAVYFGSADAASAAGGSGLCSRTPVVRDAIVAAIDQRACGTVTDVHLRDVVSLDLSNQGLTSLKKDDLVGLQGLNVLDLSGNDLASLPEGVFDDLLLLRTLRLHDNSLTALPPGVFDQLFLLEEITLHNNEFTSLPADLFEELSRLDGFSPTGNAPDNSGPYPRIQRFLDRHGITTPEEFIAALPTAYKQRFTLVFSSEAAAAAHVSGDYPRVISFGADGALTFAWNTDPSAPARFRQSVEFLRQNDTDWTIGVIDFSGAAPQIVEPESCQSCHGSLNKPLWGDFPNWPGVEYVGSTSDPAYEYTASAVKKALTSSDPRIEPLDFSASSFELGVYTRRFLKVQGGSQPPYSQIAEEAGAVWSWRHAEVLYRILKGRPDYPSFRDRVICDTEDIGASLAVTVDAFSPSQHNLFFSAADEGTPDVPGQRVTSDNPRVTESYYYNSEGNIGDAVVFLMVADIWRDEPVVRRLYRSVTNDETLSHTNSAFGFVKLHYGAGSATAEDELIQKLRLHFAHGTPSVNARDLQNSRYYLGGIFSANFRDGHTKVMGPRICSALTDSAPGGLSVALREGDAVLRWDAPSYDADAVTGYRIWQGSDTVEPTVLRGDTGSTSTTWTDENPPAGERTYLVQALYDGYYAGRKSSPAQVTAPEAPQSVHSLSAVVGAGGVTLGWEPPTGGLQPTGYRILRGASASSLGVLAADTLSATTTYVDDTASVDDTYFYSVRALSGDRVGPAVDPVRVGGLAAPEFSGQSALVVVEGDTAVATLAATDADTAADDLEWSIPSGIAGGVDRSHFSLSSGGVLAFVAGKDFEAPDDAGLDGTYEVTVRVTDGDRSDTADLTVSLSNRNEAPTADAGDDEDGIDPGAPVTLFGAASDPDVGDTLTYSWAQTAGPTVALSVSNLATTTFRAPSELSEDTVLRFRLRVTDAGGLYHDDEVDVTVVAAAASGLTAAAHHVPEVHDGGRFSFDLHFSKEPSLSYVTVRDTAFEVTGGTVEGARRRTPGSDLSWTILVSPDSSGTDVVLVLAGDRGCDTDGAICTADGEQLSGDLTITVPAAAVRSDGQTETSPLTAAALYVPEVHDGGRFSFDLHFSKEPSLSYVTVRDTAFEVTGGTVEGARRRTPGSDLSWTILVSPDSSGTDVVLVLAGDRGCDTDGAICTADGEQLSGDLTITVPGSVEG